MRAPAWPAASWSPAGDPVDVSRRGSRARCPALRRGRAACPRRSAARAPPRRARPRAARPEARQRPQSAGATRYERHVLHLPSRARLPRRPRQPCEGSSPMKASVGEAVVQVAGQAPAFLEHGRVRERLPVRADLPCGGRESRCRTRAGEVARVAVIRVQRRVEEVVQASEGPNTGTERRATSAAVTGRARLRAANRPPRSNRGPSRRAAPQQAHVPLQPRSRRVVRIQDQPTPVGSIAYREKRPRSPRPRERPEVETAATIVLRPGQPRRRCGAHGGGRRKAPAPSSWPTSSTSAEP